MDWVMADERTESLFENKASAFLISTPSPSGTPVVTYTCRRDELLNVAIFHNMRPHEKDARDWNSGATVEDSLEVLEGFHPAWNAIASNADFVKVYTVDHRAEVSTITRGHAVIIGDAAHPMMPTHAQGGCMVLEDAAALEVLFSDFPSRDSVEAASSCSNSFAFCDASPRRS